MIAQQVIAGIFVILVLFWLFAPQSQAKDTIQAISGGAVNTINALQGYVPAGTQQVPMMQRGR